MHYEEDYTLDFEEIMELFDKENCLNKEEKNRRMIEKGNLLIKLFHLRKSQFKQIPSKNKKEKIIWFYNQLVSIAFVRSGKVTLDINDETMEATLTYWGKYIMQTPESNDETRTILIKLFSTYSNFWLDSKNGGFRIRIFENLYDLVKVSDKSDEIIKLEKMIREI